MTFNWGKPLYIFAFATNLLLTAFLGYLGYEFYSNGMTDGNGMVSIFEANYELEKLKDGERIENIRHLISKGRIRDTVKNLDMVKRDVDKIHHSLKVDSYDDYEKHSLELRKSLSDLISMPEIRSMFIVLNNKINAFYSFVYKNNWKTLTRMSRRIKAKMTPARISGFNTFKLSRLRNNFNSIEKDIKVMEQVTISSILNDNDKNEIIKKIKAFQTEVAMIREYLSSARGIGNNYMTWKESFSLWLKEVSPAIVLEKLNIQNRSLKIFWSLCIGLLVNLLFLFALRYLYIRNSKGNRQRFEKMATDLIKQDLIPVKSNKEMPFSESFNNEFDKLRQYVHKRMSFGSIFQEAVPFSSLLLDSNLNLVWANPLFYEHWKLKGREGDHSISWDYLQQFTNLGEDDPVMMALKEGIAGIYQIQVRYEGEDAFPFEMYVSPVEYAEQSRIMVFFYPLRSLEETISNQTRSIIGPISRTLKALSANQVDAEFLSKIEKDFDIAGITEVLEQFKDFYSYVEKQKMQLMNDVDSLEGILMDEIKNNDDGCRAMSDQVQLAKTIENHFAATRNSLIKGFEVRYGLEDMMNECLDHLSQIIHTEESILISCEKNADTIHDGAKAFQNVTAIRENFKTFKGQIEDTRIKIAQALEQSIIFLKRENINERAERGLGKIKTEIKNLENELHQLGKLSRNLDVGLSKVQLILDAVDRPDFDNVKKGLLHHKEFFEYCQGQVKELNNHGEQNENEIIYGLKTMVTDFKQLNTGIGKSLEDGQIRFKDFTQRSHPSSDFIDDFDNEVLPIPTTNETQINEGTALLS